MIPAICGRSGFKKVAELRVATARDITANTFVVGLAVLSSLIWVHSQGLGPWHGIKRYQG